MRTRHVDRVSSGIADGSQMVKQRIDIDGLSASHDTREVGVILCRIQAHGSGFQRHNDDRSRAGRNLPQHAGAFFLDLWMWRQIFKWQHIVRR